MEASVTQMSSDLENIRKDAEVWFSAKKKLEDEKTELQKSLDISRLETTDARAKMVASRLEASQELRRAKDDLKTAEKKLHVLQENMANVFVDSFHNALAQVEVRNPEFELQFDGVHPEHEARRDQIVRKNADDSYSVVWSFVPSTVVGTTSNLEEGVTSPKKLSPPVINVDEDDLVRVSPAPAL